ncbi:MAG: TonB-dependent receptor, partial [Proteobacteria bacterium]
YGAVGNQAAIGFFQYQALYAGNYGPGVNGVVNGVLQDNLGYPFGGGYQNGIAQTQPSNPDLRWETDYTTDLGIDAAFLRGALTITADWFNRRSENFLLSIPASPQTGYGFITRNVGEMTNKGVEIAINYRGNNSVLQEASPLVNPNFTAFDIDAISTKNIEAFDPLQAPLGTVTLQENSVVALNQRIGKINTQYPQLIFSNDGGRKMTGFGDRNIGDSAITDFFQPGEISKIEQEVIPTLLANNFWEGELKFRHFQTGASIPVVYNLFPIFNKAKEKIGYATVTRDISESKRFEASIEEAREIAEKANSAKSVFLANMSHEIRSPLGAIMGFSELMRGQDVSEKEIGEFVSVIERNSNHVLRIIDDILDLSKVEAGKMLIEHIVFSLPDLLADFSSLMALRARSKGIAFELKLATKIPECIITDPTRLRQILTNI